MASANAPGRHGNGRTQARSGHRRAAIVGAAMVQLEEHGVEALKLPEIARAVGLKPSSFSYYFPNRDALAAEVYRHVLAGLAEMVEQAGREPTTGARLRALFTVALKHEAAMLAGRTPKQPLIGDIRALRREMRAPLTDAYLQVNRTIREWFRDEGDSHDDWQSRISASYVLESLFWLRAWVGEYSDWEHAALVEEIVRFLENGFLARAAEIPITGALSGDAAEDDDSPREAFLRAATRLINRYGSRGSSVERVAEELGVTKGSFYHHLEDKDDLVSECFARSHEQMAEIQRLADGEEGDAAARLLRAATEAAAVQFAGRFPFLRTSAYIILPPYEREQSLARARRITRWYAGQFAAGIAQRTIRPLDPFVASQMLFIALNAASDLAAILSERQPGDAARDYVALLTRGLA
ncbi:TetR/AcrR family transcriptional regulator [Qipengyuania marisflavi]|nr:TetR/AcrR family transcriptional regulator [Qipengyuania marisflavi]